MAVYFHELPVEVFNPKARPYIARLNRELRQLFALEGTISEPLGGMRSDGSIVRREEPTVAISRITPSVGTVAEENPTVSTSVTSALVFGNDNRLIRSDGTQRDVQVGGMALSDVGHLTPVTSDAQDIGSATARIRNLFVQGIQVDGTTLSGLSTFVTAGITFGTDNAIVRVDGTTRGTQGSSLTIDDTGHTTPLVTDTQDLGSATLRFRNLFAQDAQIDGVTFGGISNAVTAGAAFVTDNSILRVDGTTRGAQGSSVTIDDNGRINFPSTSNKQQFSTAVASNANNAGFHFKDTVARAAGDVFAFESASGITTCRLRSTAELLVGQGTLYAGFRNAGFRFGVNSTGGGTPTLKMDDVGSFTSGPEFISSGLMAFFAASNANGGFALEGSTHIIDFVDASINVLSYLNASGRFSANGVSLSLYKDLQGTPRYWQVNGLQGGGFGFIDASTTEPIT